MSDLELRMCTKCTNNKLFNKWIRSEGEVAECDFDPLHGKKCKTLSIEDISHNLDEWLRDEYIIGREEPRFHDDDDDPWYGRMGESIEEILYEVTASNSDKLIKALISGLEEVEDYDPSFESSFYESGNQYELREKVDAELEDEALERFFDDYETRSLLKSGNPIDELTYNLSQLRKLLDAKDSFEPVMQKFQNMMIFSFCITCLERYLSETFAKSVLKNKDNLNKYLSIDEDIKGQKIGDILKTNKNLKDFAKSSLSKILFHNLGKAKARYREILGIDIDISLLTKYVLKRHDFVHRAGESEAGKKTKTTKSEILDLITNIQSLADKIDYVLNPIKVIMP